MSGVRFPPLHLVQSNLIPGSFAVQVLTTMVFHAWSPIASVDSNPEIPNLNLDNEVGNTLGTRGDKEGRFF